MLQKGKEYKYGEGREAEYSCLLLFRQLLQRHTEMLKGIVPFGVYVYEVVKSSATTLTHSPSKVLVDVAGLQMRTSPV